VRFHSNASQLRIALALFLGGSTPVKGGVKPDQWGGVKVGQ